MKSQSAVDQQPNPSRSERTSSMIATLIILSHDDPPSGFSTLASDIDYLFLEVYSGYARIGAESLHGHVVGCYC